MRLQQKWKSSNAKKPQKYSQRKKKLIVKLGLKQKENSKNKTQWDKNTRKIGENIQMMRKRLQGKSGLNK